MSNRQQAATILAAAVLLVFASTPAGLERWAGRARPAIHLGVMTFNVGDPRRKGFPVEAIAECILRDGRPDILRLQEARGCHASLKLPARLGYRNSVAASATTIRGSGLCVLSNLPILSREEYALPHEGKGTGALCARLELHGQPVIRYHCTHRRIGIGAPQTR